MVNCCYVRCYGALVRYHAESLCLWRVIRNENVINKQIYTNCYMHIRINKHHDILFTFINSFSENFQNE